ncbi:hypothetical protein [Yeosuana sp. AK3]
MKKITIWLVFLMLISCGQEKIIQLPEINHSNISEIQDVSAAYLFYDETLEDGVELNRKNLIGTTNWLVNIDKRLTLKQALPKIIFLQDKKRQAEVHKNENAKNYFTCHDLSKKNLGFIDFTEIMYRQEKAQPFLNSKKAEVQQLVNIKVHSLDSTYISIISNDTSFTHTSNQKELLKHLSTHLSHQERTLIISEIKESLSFQDYITYKFILSQIHYKNVTIGNDEFVFN